MLKLIIEDDEGRKTVVPFARDEITIGRQEGNTIRLTERNVSRRHARLMRQNGHVLIEDLGSYNGIRINGDLISGQVQINDGDLVQIGDYDLAIQSEDDKAAGAATVPLSSAPRAEKAQTSATVPYLSAVDAPQEAAEDDVEDADGGEAGADAQSEGDTGGAPRHQATAVIRIDQVSTARNRQVKDLDASEAPRLVVLNTEFAGKEFTCTRTEVRIGRVEDNEIAIDHRSLSRTHCKVVREESGEWKVVDLQSANGIMVNGETYAQVTLRSGDVIELGHVKIKFIAAGEDYVPTSGPSSTIEVEGGESERGAGEGGESAGGSKAPLIAVAATLAVLVLGGGGYALWKGLQGAPKPPEVAVAPLPKPVKPSIVVQPPPDTVAPGPNANNPPDDEPTPPPKEDPEVAKKAAEKSLATARAAIALGDFEQAEMLLKSCKVGDSPCPETRQMLTQMEGEQGFRTAISEAERALDDGDLEKARAQLELARPSKLLKARRDALEARRAEAVKAKIAENAAKKLTELKKPDLKVPAEVKPPERPAGGKTEEAKKFLEEAVALSKDKEWTAVIVRADKCTRSDPSLAACYRVRGTAHGRLGESELAAKDYKLFVRFAAADDEKLPGVKNWLKQYEETLKK